MGFIETGGKGDTLGPWTSGACYKNPNAPSHYVGGDWGSDAPFKCYGAPELRGDGWPWFGEKTTCGTVGGEGKRWGSCKWWREWCSYDFWGALHDQVNKDIETLEEKAAETPESIDQIVQLDQFNALQGQIERNVNALVGGGNLGEPGAVSRGDSRVYGTGIGQDGSNAAFCRARVAADYGSGACSTSVYPQKCTHPGEGFSVYPLAYYDEWAAGIRQRVVTARFLFMENHPEAAADAAAADQEFSTQSTNIATPEELADAGASDPNSDPAGAPPGGQNGGGAGGDLQLASFEFPTWAIGVGVGIVALAFLGKRYL